MLPVIATVALGVVFLVGLATRTYAVSAAALAVAAFPIADLLDADPEYALAFALVLAVLYGVFARSPTLTAVAVAALAAFLLRDVMSIAPTAVFVFAVLVGVLKGRYVLAITALAAAVALGFVSEAAIGTIRAGEAPFGDAWIVVLLQFALWLPALAAAAGAATEGSLWAGAGRPRWATPIVEVAANFIWVFAIILLGILFDGAGIVGGDVFCAIFAGLLAAVLLFGLGAARTQPA